MAVEKGAKTAVVWLLFTLPLSLLEGVFSQNGPQRSRARRCCAAKRTLHGEDRSEILDKRERGGPKWTAKMAQSLTASDMLDHMVRKARLEQLEKSPYAVERVMVAPYGLLAQFGRAPALQTRHHLT